MKSLNLVLFLFFQVLVLSAQTEDKSPAPGLTFHTNSIELGEVTKGDKREMVFEFTNTGTENVEIELVSSCECTTIDYPRGIIEVGESSKLEVVFDSTEKEESETVDVDVILKNIDPKTESQIMYFLSYTFELKQ